MGLCDDWSFEEDAHRRTAVPLVVFDHSVDRRFWVRRFFGSTYHGIRELSLEKLKRAWRFTKYRKFFGGQARRHVRLAIGRRDHGLVDLEEALRIADMRDNVLLKIDIEGAEYRILDQIVAHRASFCGIAMELHDIDIHQDKIDRFLHDLSGDFILVHFHANNATRFGPADMSIVVEVSLMRRSLLQDGERLIEHDLPLPDLDAKNLPDAPDIIVRFE